ncbi:hypothetical protein DFH06DRAFT_100802 [Mycena polygramma]|nr:hypothetical protein DFH06DRAFT_100802 [Mycena polygramma]
MLQELSNMDRIMQLQDEIQQLLTIKCLPLSPTLPRAPISSRSARTSRSRNNAIQRSTIHLRCLLALPANKKELVTDLIVKAKQVEYLIKSLPEPEPEEEQAKRLQILDEEMTVVNEEYVAAVARAKDLHGQITDVLHVMLKETDTGFLDKL